MPDHIDRSYFIAGCGLLAICGGALALCGWQFDITFLKSLLPGITPMNPVTALTFICCGLWLLLFNRNTTKPTPPILLLQSIVLLIGFIHLATYFIHFDKIRLDYLLYGSKMRESKIFNLVAPNTAFVFFIAGIIMITTWSRHKAVHLLRQFFILLGFFMVYVSFLGYTYNITPAYRLGAFTAMALTTAIVFLALYIGLFISNTHYGISRSFASNLIGGHMLRKIVPLILLLPPITGYLSLLGEREGFYPTEFGIGLYTLVFTIVVFVFITLYATLENKKQLYSLKSQLLLEESEKKFRTVFNSLREGVMSTDPNGKVQFCNPSLCLITGYTETELNNKNIIELLMTAPEQATFYKNRDQAARNTKEDYHTQITKKNGEKIWISIKSLPVADKQGNISNYISSINDITEDKIILQDLNAFTASAAHDLNSPLAKIIMMANLIDTESLDDEQKMFLVNISEVAHSMGQLLRDLLSFSKLGMGQLEKANLDMDKMVSSICKEQTPKDYHGKITIHPLPEIFGNDSAMRQLFNNLISNAIKYSSKKTYPEVEIGSYERSGETVFYIKDNGVGLNEKQISNLFTPFKRFHSQFEGNGMGLAIVKRIVEKHNGSIWAESEPGNGVMFHFILSADIKNAIPA